MDDNLPIMPVFEGECIKAAMPWTSTEAAKNARIIFLVCRLTSSAFFLPPFQTLAS
jgi:hypothetical protein